MLDSKIINGKLIDTEKEQLLPLQLGIKDGKIACIGEDLPDAVRVIDAKGLYVSPGFIDIHMHEEDFSVTKKQEWDISECMLRMGVTTAVIGHGCGHNMLGSASVAAGIILSRKLPEIGGSVVVMGTPAEETSGAKVNYTADGAFSDIDAVIVDHPASDAHHKSGRSLALRAMMFIFDGKPAHAASAPAQGINALDACIITDTAIGLLRQQTRDDARIHGISSEGGLPPNVIPDHCVMKFYVRAADRIYRDELMERVINCAKAGALATGCTLSMDEYELGYDDLKTNENLSELFTECLHTVGVQFVDGPRKTFGSVDAGNVSYVCPTIHPYFAIGCDPSIAAHTKEFAALTQTLFAKDSMMQAAQAMALAGCRMITEPETMAKIRKEFDEMPK